MTEIHPTTMLAALLLLAVYFPLGALAYPTGAGQCITGPAVGSPHLTNSAGVVTGSLTDGGFIVTLDTGEPLVSGTASSIIIKEPSTLELTAASDTKPFKGFLVRLGRGPNDIDTTGALTSTDSNVQVAQTVCIEAENVGGVTHITNNEKMSISATVQLDEPAPELLLEVTVVVKNNATGSEYYYDSFIVNAEIPNTGVLMPVAAPTIPAGTNPKDLTTPPVNIDPSATPVPTTLTFIAPNAKAPEDLTKAPTPTPAGMAPTTTKTSNAKMPFPTLVQIALLGTLMVAGLVVTLW